jgi:hypothetical protein
VVVGIDFDNTIVSYDRLMRDIAAEWGVVAPDSTMRKREIRDTMRARPNGEHLWQQLQADAYGRRLPEAVMADGVREFLLECRQRAVRVHIVSHKTQFAAAGRDVNLRDAATRWLEMQGVFGQDGLGVERDDVHFESTRAEKAARIQALGVSHFIDDLEEVFAEPGFPEGVERILYAPDAPDASAPSGAARVIGSWAGIREHMFPASALDAVSRAIGSEVVSADPAGHGGNSKVLRVRCRNGAEYAVKRYLQPTVSGRSRLEVEFGAMTFMWAQGLRSIPRPIVSDPANHFGVYEFVEGRRIDSSAVGEAHIESLVRFVAALRDLGRADGARELPPASEACFSVDAVVRNIEGRLQRLRAVPAGGTAHAAMRAFVETELTPAFVRVSQWASARMGSQATAPLPDSLRTLSPSDLGFHNALQRPNGDVVFLDFEYFGWDDPAKLIADFTLHPAMNLNAGMKTRAVTALLQCWTCDEALPHRLECLSPLFGLKWCVIMLNEFIPSDLERREFAAAAAVDREDARLRQLNKASALLQRVMRELPS